MGDQRTCGEGLAAHSPLTASLGDLTTAVADVLEIHTTGLDLEDENGKRERDVYSRLVEEHRQTAAELLSTAEEMRGYRDLPMARHDPAVVAGPAATDAFARFVATEEALLASLADRLAEDRGLLERMRQAA